MYRAIKVVVCAGTACHVMGGSELFLVKASLEPELAARVELEASPCLELCHRAGAVAGGSPGGGAPFALVDGRLVSRADLATLIAAIRSRAEPDATASGTEPVAAAGRD